MKSTAILVLSLGLALSSLGNDAPSVNAFTETLSRGPWADLPVRTVGLVRHAKVRDRQATTVAAVKAALGLNPAAATAVVGAIARALPNLAAVAAETAAAEQPKQAPEIALAAAAGARSAAADIVAGVCRAAPAQYEGVAVAVSEVGPGLGKEILRGVAIAQPDLKVPIDRVVAGYSGHVPSVALVLTQAKGTPPVTDPIRTGPVPGGGPLPYAGPLSPVSQAVPSPKYKTP
jgi:phage tail protein X